MKPTTVTYDRRTKNNKGSGVTSFKTGRRVTFQGRASDDRRHVRPTALSDRENSDARASAKGHAVKACD